MSQSNRINKIISKTGQYRKAEITVAREMLGTFITRSCKKAFHAPNNKKKKNTISLLG